MNDRVSQARNISVIIPTWNRAHKIVAAIDSVLAQSYGFYELIVVDDASTDHTDEVVRVYMEKDSRIRYHKQPVNGGAAAARNTGVQMSEADIIAFLDSDDIWLPEKLEKQMAYWELHPDYSLIYSKFRYREGSEGGYDPFADTDGKTMEGDLYLQLLESNVIGTPTVLVDKGAFLACGGFDESLRALEDWEFAVRFAKDYLIGFTDAYLTECMIERKTSVSADNEEHFRVRFRMLKDHREILEQNGKLEYLIAGLFSAAQQVGLGDFAKVCFRETFFPGIS